jgi:hypothetical protein
MQYILTQEEYDALKKQQTWQFNINAKKLQELCTKIADEMPVNWGWNGPDPKPWGCIITQEAENPYNEWYCDECPVRTICPGSKNYSK